MTLPYSFLCTIVLKDGEIMDFPKRKSPRIPGYDYATPNYYFITICTYDKTCIFGTPGRLNEYGKIAEEHLRKIPGLNPRIKLDKYVVMPNHIHVIFIVTGDNSDSGSRDLSVCIGQFKMSVTKKIRIRENGKKVWQRSFHDHVIRNQNDYEKIWTYIENNPLKWKEDCFYTVGEGH